LYAVKDRMHTRVASADKKTTEFRHKAAAGGKASS